MKKLVVLIAALLAALFVVGCASKPPAGPTAADMMADARGGAPDGTLVGQATAQGSKDSSAQRTAENNAVVQIRRGLKYIAGELVDAQVQSGRVSSDVSSSLKQTMNTALDRVALGSMQKVASGADGTFRAWAIYSLDKAGALQAVTSAATTAKETVAAGNFTPSTGFDDVFAKAAAREWK